MSRSGVIATSASGALLAWWSISALTKIYEFNRILVVCILSIAIILIIGSIYQLINGSDKTGKAGKILVTACVSYLWLEFLLIMAIGFNIYQPISQYENFGTYTWDRPCASFDPVAGFRHTQDFRVASVSDNNILFKTDIQVNQAGFVSSREYSRKKSDSTSKRYIIFGDSFTAGSYLETNWPDRCQKELANRAGQQLELYSFSLDGIGVQNWHSIFMNEVIPNYQFDAVILAIFAGDLSRPFLIAHHEDGLAKAGYFDIKPKDESDFRSNYLDKMDVIDDFSSWAMIDSIDHNTPIIQRKKSFITAIKPWVIDEIITISERMKFLYERKRELAGNRNYTDNFSIGNVEEYLLSEYGNSNGRMIMEILDYCNKNGKELIIAAIPHEADIQNYDNGEKSSFQIELEAIADHYGAAYFDGVEIFKDLSKQQLKKAFIKGDVHWSQEGSDYFSSHFTTFLDSVNTRY